MKIKYYTLLFTALSKLSPSLSFCISASFAHSLFLSLILFYHALSISVYTKHLSLSFSCLWLFLSSLSLSLYLSYCLPFCLDKSLRHYCISPRTGTHRHTPAQTVTNRHTPLQTVTNCYPPPTHTQTVTNRHKPSRTVTNRHTASDELEYSAFVSVNPLSFLLLFFRSM